MWGFAHQWLVDPWGYGGYGPIHMIIWIILAIAFGRCPLARREGATSVA